MEKRNKGFTWGWGWEWQLGREQVSKYFLSSIETSFLMHLLIFISTFYWVKWSKLHIGLYIYPIAANYYLLKKVAFRYWVTELPFLESHEPSMWGSVSRPPPILFSAILDYPLSIPYWINFMVILYFYKFWNLRVYKSFNSGPQIVLEFQVFCIPCMF